MPDRIAEHYDRHAHAFDHARRGSFAEKGWFDRFLMGLPRGGHVLDLGCGGGEPVARYMLDGGFQVTGVDASAKMIALVRTRFGRQTWHHADMRAVTIKRLFDGVLAWDSLFHLRQEEQRTMIPRIAGWLKLGGMALFNTGPEKGEAIGCFKGSELYHASLAPTEYRALFAKCGLEELSFVPEDQRAGGRSVWLVRKR